MNRRIGLMSLATSQESSITAMRRAASNPPPTRSTCASLRCKSTVISG
jgi:hypothetical protein